MLVDRIWPRGMTKAQVAADLWLKDLAPSTELRKWFRHEAPRWAEFKRRYIAELEQRPEAVAVFRLKAGKGKVTLLYSARDAERNQAVVLRDYLQSGAGKLGR